MKTAVALLTLLSLLGRPSAAQSRKADEPEAHPGRPTVSTPGTLTPVGHLQLETGFARASAQSHATAALQGNSAANLAPAKEKEGKIGRVHV